MINPSNLDLLTLRIFVLTAQSKSLTITAERVHMTLSAVSRRLTDLEQVIGMPLFERRHRAMELTAAGDALLGHAQLIVSASERLVGSMSEFSQGIRGTIRLWANTSAIVQFLPKDLYAYRTVYNEVKLELEERLSDEIIRALQSGDIDLGVVANNATSVGIEKIVYRKDQLVLVLPQGHALHQQDQASLDDILDRPFVGTNEGSAILRLLSDLAAARGRSLKISLQASSFEAVLSLVEAGHGVSVLPRAAVSKSVTARGMTMLPIKERWAVRQLYLAFRSEQSLNPDVSRLMSFLRDRAAR
ncbi:DNA-binding transcriptional LysR family regulator [Pseudomonas sp. W3I7]|uniref:LysR family transcriptional regulator n=1 Tax=Pseudomonas sp. W3I7 TaxID=3042292 RepID=UPI00278F2BA2|nr:LysR family transcriptional regulator [Pseudomonas sp. W3I7]MDQ0703984.1 DNA-binding transcriptional LysR family regulator [Pseudomonas sp. W3I7]